MIRLGICRKLTVRPGIVQNRHMRMQSALAVMVFTLFLVGCQGAGRAVQSAAMTDRLTGTWSFQGAGDFQLILEPDGTYRASLWGARGSGQWEFSKPFLVLTGTDRQERMSLEGWNFETSPHWIELGAGGSTVRLFRGPKQASAPPKSTGTPTSELPPIPRVNMPPSSAWNPPKTTPSPIRCSLCNGSGRVNCFSCSGKGTVEKWHSSPSDPMGDYTTESCTSCGGIGTQICSGCNGVGKF